MRLIDTLSNNTEPICKSQPGTAFGLRTSGLNPVCLLTGNFAASRTNCIDPDYCIPNVDNSNRPCISYCQNTTAVSPDMCTGSWKTWQGSSGQHSACVRVNISKAICDADGHTWKFGRDFFPAISNTEEECKKGVCIFQTAGFNGNVGACNQFRCTTCVTGLEPQCFSKEACESPQNPGCIQNTGCLLKHGFVKNTGVQVTYLWSPTGDVFPYLQSVCIYLFFLIQNLF